ncbi:NUDIX hydrolase [Streptomyces sp. NPDC004610]|uniref:NUDIX hydrolase n=1 Tax=unclassified Streptomyces TaxID=2593676 RepID=UPI0033B92A4B
MTLADDGRGNALTDFLRSPESEPPADAPLPLALVALWQADRVLLVLHRVRRAWELPGGLIDPGESPREAAVRELWEESGQRPAGALRFTGYARFVLAPEGRTEYGALFTGEAAQNPPGMFRPNVETMAVHWWDVREPLGAPQEALLGAPIQPLDACLAELTRGG